MKKMFAVLLSSLMLCSAAACGQPDETKSSVQSQATASSEAVSGVSAAEVSEDDPFAVESVAPAEEHDIVKSLDEILDKYKYEGVVYAVKGGEPLHKEEIVSLLKTYVEQGIPLTCPHGRPVVARLSKRDMEKMFKRIV